MFPFVDGFHWTFGHILFLTVFGLVVAAMATALFLAAQRVLAGCRGSRVDQVRWQSGFHELSEQERRCRHELAGRVASRECHNGFECGRCPEHQRFASIGTAAPPGPASSLETFGLEFPPGRLYHRGHTWVRVEDDGTLTIGLDDLGRRLLGTPERVELPRPGQKLIANGTAWRACRNGAPVRILSPVEGAVIATGGPGQEWYLKVRPTRANPNLAHLLRGPEVSAWLRRELERLQILAAPAGAGAVLADGGVLAEDLPQAQPGAGWDKIYGGMFLDP